MRAGARQANTKQLARPDTRHTKNWTKEDRAHNAAYYRKYYRLNACRVKAQRRAHYDPAYGRAYRKKNAARIKIYQHNYHAAHRAEIAARRRRGRQA